MNKLKETLIVGLGILVIILLGIIGFKVNSSNRNTADALPKAAQVIKVQPHYVTKKIAYRDCRAVAETVVQPSSGSKGVGALIGGVAGGAAGSVVRGNGQTAAIVGGALLGALAGHAVESQIQKPETYTIYKPVCTTRYVNKSIKSGYEVTYTYEGRQGVMIMQSQPVVGSTIELSMLTKP